MTKRDRVLAFIVPLLLVAVATNQVRLATTADLTPWLGGGFGMFASPDRVDHRAMRGYFETPVGDVSIDVGSLENVLGGVDRSRLRIPQAMPTPKQLGKLSETIVAQAWILEDGVATTGGDPVLENPAFDPSSGIDSLDVSAVRVEVWRASYDKGSGRIVPVLLRAHRSPVGQHDE